MLLWKCNNTFSFIVVCVDVPDNDMKVFNVALKRSSEFSLHGSLATEYLVLLLTIVNTKQHERVHVYTKGYPKVPGQCS
jgi:hypothetical protein